jgi:hypothetical protein
MKSRKNELRRPNPRLRVTRRDCADGRDDVDDVDQSAYEESKCEEGDEKLVEGGFAERDDGARGGSRRLHLETQAG